MTEPERQKFNEICERVKRGAYLGDDIEWLVAELDSYSRAWKTERETLRKLVDEVSKMVMAQDRVKWTGLALIGRAKRAEGMDAEILALGEALKGFK